MLLDILESATRYPKTQTYHQLIKRWDTSNKLYAGGVIRQEFTDKDSVFVTEKIDGENARIILFPHVIDWFIGSRNELLKARGDRVTATSWITKTLEPVAEKLANTLVSDVCCVFYFEVYGGKCGKAWKQYTDDDRERGYRLIALREIPEWVFNEGRGLNKSRTDWRENGEGWATPAELDSVCSMLGDTIQKVPLISTEKPPRAACGVREWLEAQITTSQAKLSEGGLGRPEGVVVATPNRDKVVKIRFSDYPADAFESESSSAQSQSES